MFCNKCGNKVKEGTLFCPNCGNKMEIEENKTVLEQPVREIPKKKNNKLLKVLILIVTLGFLTSLTFLLINLFSGNKGSSSTNILSNTTWNASDNSEMIFEEDRLYWYEYEDDHDDNYYAGSYKFYRGKEAVEHITTELSSYGVTKSEIQGVFDRSSIYSEEDFIVIDINYDKFIMNGMDRKITRPQVPLYGFILKNDTYLDVANMNTATYYKFTKK